MDYTEQVAALQKQVAYQLVEAFMNFKPPWITKYLVGRGLHAFLWVKFRGSHCL